MLVYFSSQLIFIGFISFIVSSSFFYGDIILEIIFKPIEKFYFYNNKVQEGKYVAIIFSKSKSSNFLIDIDENLLMRSEKMYLSDEY